MFAMKMDISDDYKVDVATTHNRGWTASEVSERCVAKIMSVSENAPPVIKDQALAFQDDLKCVVEYYMKEAIKSDRTTVINTLIQAGHPKLAEMIRRI